MKRKDREMLNKIPSNISKKQADQIKQRKAEKKKAEKKSRMKKRLIILGGAIILTLIITGVVLLVNNSGGDSDIIDEPIAETKSDVVTVMTSQGDFQIELLPEAAPQTVAKFKSVVGEGHFNGSFFHRILAGNSIECAINPDSPARPGFDSTMRVENSGIPPVKYSVSTILQPGKPSEMKTGFFKIHMMKAEDPNLEGTVFGNVISGQEVVDKIMEEQVVSHQPKNEYDVDEAEVSFPVEPENVKVFEIKFGE